MIAPSPDWFVGVSSFNLCDNGEWIDDKTIELFGYDGGSRQGTAYALGGTITSATIRRGIDLNVPVTDGIELLDGFKLIKYAELEIEKFAGIASVFLISFFSIL